MIKNFILISLIIVFFNFPASARLKMTRQTEKTYNIYIPHFKVLPRHNRIYTPDRYSCSLRRNLNYCVDFKGKALNGQIIITDGNSVAYETFKNGYQHGETLIYTLDGTLAERTTYVKGLLNGPATEYYLNGNVWLTKNYKDGTLHGRVEEYDINGGLIGKMTYKKGWFKDGYCANENSGKTMFERFNERKYNKIVPCSSNQNDELM